MKRVILVHGWSGSPTNAWFPWMKIELEKRGFEVIVPEMPNPDEPNIDIWIPYLSRVAGKVDRNTYFVGHSVGSQAIMRYLETLPEETRIGGVLFVAGFFRLLHLETNEEKIIAKPWLETPINLTKIKGCTNKIVAIFSDNDQDVDLGDRELFEKGLGAKTIVEHGMEHFSDDAGVFELPSALQAILEMSK